MIESGKSVFWCRLLCHQKWFYVTHCNFKEILSCRKKQSGQVLLCRIEVMKERKNSCWLYSPRLCGSAQLIYEIEEKFPRNSLHCQYFASPYFFHLVCALKSCLLDCDTHSGGSGMVSFNILSESVDSYSSYLHAVFCSACVAPHNMLAVFSGNIYI